MAAEIKCVMLCEIVKRVCYNEVKQYFAGGVYVRIIRK